MRPVCSVEGCGRFVKARGWCGAHYVRWLTANPVTDATRLQARPNASVAERFDRIGVTVTPEGCHEWRGARRAGGYGAVSVAVRQTDYAHRVAWQLAFGPIPDGMFVCHRCDNPPCCNPEHLFLGTNADNMRDMVAKGREQPHGRGQETCKRDHPLSGDNVYLYRGRRYCRLCGRLKTARYNERQLARRQQAG